MFYARIGENILVLAVHVDDCGMTGDLPKLITLYKCKLNDRHALMELRPMNWLLGIKVTRDRKARTISLSQTSYIESILARFSLTDAKAHATPMVPAVTYSKDDSPKNQVKAARMRLHISKGKSSQNGLNVAGLRERDSSRFPVPGHLDAQ